MKLTTIFTLPEVFRRRPLPLQATPAGAGTLPPGWQPASLTPSQLAVLEASFAGPAVAPPNTGDTPHPVPPAQRLSPHPARRPFRTLERPRRRGGPPAGSLRGPGHRSRRHDPAPGMAGRSPAGRLRPCSADPARRPGRVSGRASVGSACRTTVPSLALAVLSRPLSGQRLAGSVLDNAVADTGKSDVAPEG